MTPKNFQTLDRQNLAYTKLTDMMKDGTYNINCKAHEIFNEDHQWEDFGLANFRKAYNAIKKSLKRTEQSQQKGTFLTFIYFVIYRSKFYLLFLEYEQRRLLLQILTENQNVFLI